jgi:thiamine pyrophosphokinase
LHIVIIANGWLTQPLKLKSYDLLLAADGGAKHCLELGLTPDFVIGDMDSLDKPVLDALVSAGSKILRFPYRKDFTDLELAIQKAADLDADQVTLVAALGARWDQTFANLLLAASHPTLRIRIVDGAQEINFLHGGEKLEIRGITGDTVSLVALSNEASGIRTDNLEYPLDNEALLIGSTRGVSNVLLQPVASISLEQGLLMCSVIHHESSS